MKPNSETTFENRLLLQTTGMQLSDLATSITTFPSLETGIYIPGYNYSPKTFRIFGRIVRNSSKAESYNENKSTVTQPIIESILDTSTCRSDGQITPGRNLQIKGSCIRICSQKDDCGIFFTNCSSGKTYKIPRTDIVLNDPSLLLIFVPENMEKGEYELKISTTYNGSQKELKHCRTTVFEKKLMI
ncbi:MAG: DUF4469 domain-containing protein [Paludibacter sp.]|nr:DUF4469 domain-containing protein [Paludibacter sp.]